MILAITDDGTSVVAAKDGRFVIFAITNDRINIALKWYYFIGTASNDGQASETGLRLHYGLVTPGNPACKATAPTHVWRLPNEP